MKIASLHIYPLKSGRGIDLSQAHVGAWGLDGDRRYMVVDPDGRFITQRELQSLARIVAVEDRDGLDLSMDGMADVLRARFEPDRRLDVVVWNSHVSAALADDATNRELSVWLDRPVRLVHADRQTNRICSPDWAGEGVLTGFSDGYPILITTTGSLAELNAAALELGGEPFGMDRFRPNIVLEHPEPFAEDRWAAIEIAGIRFDLVKPCARCIMTTQDQVTGERGGPDPMPAMRRIRMSDDRRVAGVLFGWNVVARAEGMVTVGDAVKVLETRPEGWPLKRR
jgi:uncharacterized protein YcbX